MPLESVSVVIPHYRTTDALERALASVAAQTRAPLEVIVVDDGSGPEVVAEVLRLSERFGSSVRVESLPVNVGPAGARNHGWAAARAPWVAFLDADDSWHPRKLEIQGAALAAHPGALLSSHLMGAPSSLGHRVDPRAKATPISYRTLLLHNRVATSSAMVRRAVRHRFPDGRRYSEDYALWLALAADADVIHVPSPLGTRMASADGLSAKLLPMQRGELQTLRDEVRSGRLARPAWPLVATWSLARFALRWLRSPR